MYFPLVAKIIGCLPMVLNKQPIGKYIRVVNHFSLMFHEPLFVPASGLPTCIAAFTQEEKRSRLQDSEGNRTVCSSPGCSGGVLAVGKDIRP